MLTSNVTMGMHTPISANEERARALRQTDIDIAQ
jgi:hypothetical protein